MVLMRKIFVQVIIRKISPVLEIRPIVTSIESIGSKDLQKQE